MQRSVIISRCLALLLVLVLLDTNYVLAGWQLTFSDEFNNNANKVNTTKWNVFYPFSPAIINSELEFYSPDSFTFANESMVRIIAQHRPFWTYELNYTSGAMTTMNKFSQAYGFFEINCRLPNGTGFWPAFWLLPESANKPLEIDIFEILEQDPETIYTTFHCDYNSKNPYNKGSSKVIKALGDGNWHTYGLQWIPGTLIWYVDGIQVFNVSNPCIPNTPEYILVNMAIGGDWPKPPNKETPFPSYMDVDYVRVYTQMGQGKGMSLPGQIGQGMFFNPPHIDPPASAFTLGLVCATPETVAGPGSRMTISLTMTCNSGSWSNMMLQLGLYPYTLSPIGKEAIVTDTLTGVNMKSEGTYTFTFDIQIPGGANPGYYKGQFGVFDSNWKNVMWLDAVVMIGVGKDYIVGAWAGAK